MLTKADFINRFPNITEGMAVRCEDGEKLGKISAMNEDSFTVQKGFFFPKDFMFRYEDIDGLRDDEVFLSVCHTDLSDWNRSDYTGWNQVDDINTGRVKAEPRDEFRDRYAASQSELRAPEDVAEVKVPVAEEQLEAQKVVRQTGEVKIRKIVHTELKHFTVPVAREEVRVERVPLSEARPASELGEAAFKDQTVTVPVMEEEVTVTKRPVVREEVRVAKEKFEEQREVSGEVRREEVKVEGEEQLRKKRKAG